MSTYWVWCILNKSMQMKPFCIGIKLSYFHERYTQFEIKWGKTSVELFEFLGQLCLILSDPYFTCILNILCFYHLRSGVENNMIKFCVLSYFILIQQIWEMLFSELQWQEVRNSSPYMWINGYEYLWVNTRYVFHILYYDFHTA